MFYICPSCQHVYGGYLVNSVVLNHPGDTCLDVSWRNFQRGSTEEVRTSLNVCVTISWVHVPDWIKRKRGKGQLNISICSLVCFLVCIVKPLPPSPHLCFHDGLCFSKLGAKINLFPFTLIFVRYLVIVTFINLLNSSWHISIDSENDGHGLLLNFLKAVEIKQDKHKAFDTCPQV